MVLVLTKSLRLKLKYPIGFLIEGDVKSVMNRLLPMIQDKRVISVGDVISKNLIDYGFYPELIIVDGMNLREEIGDKIDCDDTITVENPKSVITGELWVAIERFFKDETKRFKKILVEGEEDLAVMPAVLHGDENTVVLYGQPNKGVVIIEVTEQKKKEISDYLNEMEGDLWN
ncbi:MAG: hypothetical protein APG08_00895 [Candidatus Methanofastidiosum methylothiophilum]|jgi:hypothetical protein|uniref:GTP-dependent dephospho-CoA kinase n=1 Tax=Candidatus Methanofastidiosum methylothiophilum TaxID=1705564 RepID=A0A150JLI8_9EURY|nr:MAG: hypothetical protein AN188_00701 [Candidatus Methanofastidiosum methylthiophilus]MBP6932955.1 GTP-dependent dephospho-CoA kinase family protein [Methanofastidiosum sp.]OQC50952.1 MAG: hypothetical protein BWX56_01193 [Euryarchaeota archaeon ADurb.Bin023]KYC56567.1 MAG: hypothetical protein APG08_00895 [Candidatus Methanofastidiosum methylthiophilus]KYC58047.1 MAG: hypothetical protein APG09_00547 [Candidatus Methanofastidiosum methylthiophilus]